MILSYGRLMNERTNDDDDARNICYGGGGPTITRSELAVRLKTAGRGGASTDDGAAG